MTSLETVKGDLGELAFALEAKLKGLHFSNPSGGDCPYDLIVDSNTKLTRLQLKTATVKEKGRDCFKVNATHGADRTKRYTQHECDVLGVFILPARTFYFIPVEDILVNTFRFYPDDLSRDSRNDNYRENWSIFT